MKGRKEFEVWGWLYNDETCDVCGIFGGRGCGAYGGAQRRFNVCESCLEKPDQIDAKLLQHINEQAASDFKCAVWLCGLVGRDWKSALKANEAMCAAAEREQAIAEAELERSENEGLPTEPPEAEAA